MCTVEMASCGLIYIPSFMEIGTDVQAILRFSLSSLKVVNVRVIVGRDFIEMGLGGMVCLPSYLRI
jgi:hypothetical protein